MQPFRKYQKTNEENLQATTSRLTQQHSGSEESSDASRPSQAVVQIPAENLSEETKDLLPQISTLGNSLGIVHLIRNRYKGDGTDFNLYYPTIAKKISDSKRTDISIPCLVADSLERRQMENGLQKTPEDVKNNAYYSLAMDASIDTQDRLRFARAITDTAKQMEGLKSVLKSLETNTKENRKRVLTRMIDKNHTRIQ